MSLLPDAALHAIASSVPAMDVSTIPVIAGFASTVIFAGSTLPMLVKAGRTRDLASYSLGNMVLANLGNLVYSAYVFSLPPGPIWVLHCFYLLTSGTMLVWFLRFGRRRPPTAPLRSGARRLHVGGEGASWPGR